MTRVDLDAVTRVPVDLAAAVEAFAGEEPSGVMAQCIAALVAELRPAREVVEAVHAQDADIYLGTRDKLADALVAYDKAVG